MKKLQQEKLCSNVIVFRKFETFRILLLSQITSGKSVRGQINTMTTPYKKTSCFLMTAYERNQKNF